MDASVTLAAAALEGSAVPGSQTSSVSAVAVGVSQVVTQTVAVACTTPGDHIFTVTGSVAPARDGDEDPVTANNADSASFVVDCVIPVQLNVKPGSTGNPINSKSMGDVPVAVLTTSAGEYGSPVPVAAASIDPLSVRFGPKNAVWQTSAGATESHHAGHLERSYERDEITRDGDLDMVLHFENPKTGLTPGDTSACVKGQLTSGAETYTFFGCDVVVVF